MCSCLCKYIMSEILDANNHSLKLCTATKYGENTHVQLNLIQCYLIKAIDNVNNKKAHDDGIIKVSFSIFIIYKRINTNVYIMFSLLISTVDVLYM